MNSLHQTRENLRLIDNALFELAQMDLWDTKNESTFNRLFGMLSAMKDRIENDLKELEEQCLENMKS